MRAKYWLLLFCASTLVGLYFASQAYFNPALRGLITWKRALAVNLTYYYLWGAAAPLVVAIARRLRVSERQWVRPLILHLVASAFVTSAIIVSAEMFLKYVADVRPSPVGKLLLFAFSANFHSGLPTYWVILFGFLAFDYYARYRDRELAASRLEARLSEARLDALKMQLQPHFLFNTLNSVSSLMYEDIESADAMLARLAEFLRMTIGRSRQHVVTLQEEVEFVRRYLDIEQVRFDDRLHVTYGIPAELRDVLVPSLVLQPLVENALRHAIIPREAGGSIHIGAEQQGEMLHLTVTDDGPGLAGAGTGETRVGLANTRARLQELYGNAQTLRLDNGPDGGVVATVAIPLQRADHPVSAEARETEAVGRP